MRVLVAHNMYRQTGGEDIAFRNEVLLLRGAGHEVREYLENNDRIEGMNRLRLGAETVWSRSSYQKLGGALREFRPDLVHFHNTFPLISPSAYSACREAGVPIVQTLHNYRLLCPQAQFVRNSRLCESCLKKRLKWPAVLYGCYRNSRSASAAVAAMVAVHNILGTWQKHVDQYIALSDFSRRKFIEGGLPSEKIAVKSNFVLSDPGARQGPGHHALFVGRLSVEKGPRLLLESWKLGKCAFPLRFVGDGPLRTCLEREKEESNLQCVTFDGWLASLALTKIMKESRFLIVASQTYENFPLTVAEAYACGVPVIAPRHGAMEEIVQNGVTGLHFQPGDAHDLLAKVRWALSNPEALEEMGRAARARYEAKYTAENNYDLLVQIYQRARSLSCEKGLC